MGSTATASGSRVGLVPAPWWRSFQFARIFASGFTQHRASPWGRRLVLLQLPIVAPMLATSALRRRLFWNGSSAVVTMAPVDDRRSSRQLASALLTCVLMYLPPTIAALLVTWLWGAAGLGLLLGLLAVVVIGGVLSLVASSRPRSKESIADERLVLEEHSGTPTWILANLVRDPSARAGAGVALLAAALVDERFQGGLIVATAAVEKLAEQYVAAGMTRARPGSLVVYKLT